MICSSTTCDKSPTSGCRCVPPASPRIPCTRRTCITGVDGEELDAESSTTAQHVLHSGQICERLRQIPPTSARDGKHHGDVIRSCSAFMTKSPSPAQGQLNNTQGTTTGSSVGSGTPSMATSSSASVTDELEFPQRDAQAACQHARRSTYNQVLRRVESTAPVASLAQQHDKPRLIGQRAVTTKTTVIGSIQRTTHAPRRG